MPTRPARFAPALHAAVLLLTLAGLSAFASAQETIHKCVSATGKVTYQDAPCDNSPAVRSPSSAPVSTIPGGAEAGVPSPSLRQLDAAVKSALAGNDLPRAKRLAVTAQHWDWIARAEKDNPALAAGGRTSAAAPASSSDDCRQARRSYDLESGSPEEIEKKRQLMYAACGMQTPPAGEAPAGQTVILTPMQRRLHPAPALSPRSGPPAARRPRTPEYPEGTPSPSEPPRKDR